MSVILDSWAHKNMPSDTKLYKQSYWSWVNFMINKFFDMFYYEYTEDLDDWDKIEETINSYIEIVGSHISKSIKLPVIKMKYKGVIFVLRYNFYNTEIVVFSDKEIDISAYSDVFESEDTTCFYLEGFPSEYAIKTPYSKSHKIFALRVCTLYDFYSIMLIIKHCINRGIV